jgi:hypothetical protein
MTHSFVYYPFGGAFHDPSAFEEPEISTM